MWVKRGTLKHRQSKCYWLLHFGTASSPTIDTTEWAIPFHPGSSWWLVDFGSQSRDDWEPTEMSANRTLVSRVLHFSEETQHSLGTDTALPGFMGNVMLDTLHIRNWLCLSQSWWLILLQRQNIELKQRGKEGVCFGSQYEGTILYDGEALAAGARGRWIHCIYFRYQRTLNTVLRSLLLSARLF